MPGLKLYSVSDSPPTLSVRIALEVLGLEYTLIDVDFAGGEHLKEEYAKINPQKEIPCIDDDGFILSERWLLYFFAYERTAIGLKKTNLALSVFNTLLQRQGTKFAAGDEVTIADFSLVTATMCLEAINFDLGQYPSVKKWYNNFKQQLPLAWNIAEVGMLEIREFDRNPPDLSALEHPIHPTRKNK